MTTSETPIDRSEHEFFVGAANHAMMVIAHLTDTPIEVVWNSYVQALAIAEGGPRQSDFVLA